MNLFNSFRDKVVASIDALAADGALPGGLDTGAVTVEPPRDAAHGDLATNAALVLARQAGRKPRDIAEALAARLADDDAVTAIDVAGPGFINLRLSDAFWHARVRDVLAADGGYGASQAGGGTVVNVEYVSVNPTGPLHVGHARGAVFGDALAALLEKAGYSVVREYYINDAGAQIDQLTRSAYLRYLEALGQEIGEERFQELFPGNEWEYRGDYLKPVGEALAVREGDGWVGAPAAVWFDTARDVAIEMMMDEIRDDLAALGVRQEVFTSERALVAAGKLDDALARLEAKGLIYTGKLDPPKGRTPED